MASTLYEVGLTWLSYFIIALFVWFPLSSVYAWYRLRHIPGPFFGKFTYLWVAYLTITGKQHHHLVDLNRKYGPLVRVGPNEVLVDNPDLIRKVSSTRNTYTRGNWYLGGKFNPYHDTMFQIIDPVKHNAVKAKLSPAYSGRDAPNLEAVVNKQVGNLIRLIRDKYLSTDGNFRPVDATRVIRLFTLDVISHLSLGQEFGYLNADMDFHGIDKAFNEHLIILTLATDIPWLRNLIFSPLFLKLFGPTEKDTKGVGPLMKVTNNIVRERYAPEAEEKHDMLGSFKRQGLSMEECQSESLFMFMAGSETTATVIRVILLYLVASPRIYQRLRQEIKDAISDGRASNPVTDIESRQLPYLQAVIYEGIRIRPPTTGMLFKDVPAGGETMHGQYIPAGTSIGVNASSLLRSEALFGPDPQVFRPERYLDADKDTSAQMKRDVEIIFGYGRWMCAGKPIAFMELYKVIFELLRVFDFQIVRPEMAMESESYMVFQDRGLMLRVTEAVPG
ncbi:pisatin demethylase [Fusarium beomiforme]|uniref:Pisatin demethylase n=1 Tax=Fusarium beomiforme TaxID=44412 RepID=A0A9P5DW62_9HYPO|nr:pisatin demethylase [Fusarium beomiforme]